MRNRPGLLAEGMTAWIRGEESLYGEAAGEVLGELAVRALLYLRALEKR